MSQNKKGKLEKKEEKVNDKIGAFAFIGILCLLLTAVSSGMIVENFIGDFGNTNHLFWLVPFFVVFFILSFICLIPVVNNRIKED